VFEKLFFEKSCERMMADGVWNGDDVKWMMVRGVKVLEEDDGFEGFRRG